MQSPGGHKAVAAIVSFPADHTNALRRLRTLENKVGHGSPGIFHQRQRGHAEMIGGDVVDLPHLGSGDDLHDGDAICSRRRSCEGCLMAIRKSPSSMRSRGEGLKRISPERTGPACATQFAGGAAANPASSANDVVVGKPVDLAFHIAPAEEVA